jgi:hypothetical protein
MLAPAGVEAAVEVHGHDVDDGDVDPVRAGLLQERAKTKSPGSGDD